MFNIHRHGGFVKGEYPIVRLAVVCACRAETCPTEQPYMVPQQEGRRPPPAIGWGRRPCGICRGDCAICGWRYGTMGDFAPYAARVFRWLRPAGISPASAGDRGRCPLDPAIWAARHLLARVVGEEFCVRARCGFAAILDVWQGAAPPPWRKRPGEHRRHTGGGQTSQEKIE